MTSADDARRLAGTGWLRERLPEDLALAPLATAFEREHGSRLRRSEDETVAELTPEAIAEVPEFEQLAAHLAGRVSELAPEVRLHKLWLVRTTAARSAVDSVPFVPHIDAARYLKAMVYLDDVEPDSGPLTLASAPPEDFEAHRRGLRRGYKARGENRIDDAGLVYTPCTGPAGTLIWFDTNTPHHAGRIADGGSRRVLRFDHEHPRWNRRSALARVWRRLIG
jgi:hypothetical protein